MGTQIFLGKPPANVEQWIKDHHGPVVKETTVAKYTAASGLPDWVGDIVGELTDSSIPNISNVEVVEIGSRVTSIGDFAFNSCSSLTNVIIPESVTRIGEEAFWGCSSLTSVEFEGNAPAIGFNAFGNVASGCKAIITSTATGFPSAGQTWYKLIVEVKS